MTSDAIILDVVRVDDSELVPLAQPRLRTDEATDAIREAILRGDFAQGQRLVESELAPRLGISKTPVREALKRLTQSGIVIAHPHRGAVVATVDEPMVRNVYEVRLLLEPPAVAAATPLHTASSLEALQEVLRGARAAGEAGDYRALSAANRLFHRTLTEPCENAILRSVLGDLQEQVALISVAAWQRKTTWRHEAEQHEAILLAVLSCDAEGAAALLRSHIAEFILEFAPIFASPPEMMARTH